MPINNRLRTPVVPQPGHISWYNALVHQHFLRRLQAMSGEPRAAFPASAPAQERAVGRACARRSGSYRRRFAAVETSPRAAGDPGDRRRRRRAGHRSRHGRCHGGARRGRTYRPVLGRGQRRSTPQHPVAEQPRSGVTERRPDHRQDDRQVWRAGRVAAEANPDQGFRRVGNPLELQLSGRAPGNLRDGRYQQQDKAHSRFRQSWPRNVAWQPRSGLPRAADHFELLLERRCRAPRAGPCARQQ